MAVLLNAGDGKFDKARTYVVRGEPSDAVIADLNRDGSPDLVVTAFESVAVLLGKGGGKFRNPVYYSTKSITQEASPYAVVVAEFDLDGTLDIATVLDEGDPGLFHGKGNGAFGPVVPIKLRDPGGTSLVAADFENDYAPDLAIVENYGYVAVLLNTH